VCTGLGCVKYIAGHDAEDKSGSGRKQQRRTHRNADLRGSSWRMAVVFERPLSRGKSETQVIRRG
jgi:hypothetical protein